ncbi:U-box domain-containing protein 27 [Tripterygium wilfordii]|uniref:U-box domain-containing protein n=1 Tax=Tripterygium wilfordii TaxID=458696 RepID=A0A7J7DFP3_TRIWF|nr:U-box domain-containing protein 27-like [Tripterygium wilfordii]KAF5745152.1 U-box domain-containing protein 27 [Tripterygium wilfordii]
MVRKDMYITVPTFFRCPISLDVMKSPVSLSTGVTYDRACIQRWLDGGNNTCPATMQVLDSKEFVPNRTLQRLIKIWSDSLSERVDSLDSVPVPSTEQIRDIIRAMETDKGDQISEYLSRIVRFARESDGNRSFLATTAGFEAMVVDLLSRNADDSTIKNVNTLEQAVRVLELTIDKFGDNKELTRLILKSDRDRLASLVLVLQQGSTDSRIASLKILESVAVDVESKMLIADRDGVLTVLLKLISSETDPGLIEASLSCLTAISMPRRVRLKLLKLGLIGELKNLLAAPNSSVSITEKSLKLLEMMSACKEGRMEISGDASLIKLIVQKLLKASRVATEHAVTILWSVCYLFGEQAAREAVAKSNGMTKVLLLMQSDCSPAVRQMSADLLKIFRVNSKSCLSSYDTKTTHIMPF